MERKCFRCKKNEPEANREIRFKRKGFTFTIHSMVGMCHACAKSSFLEKLNSYLSLVTLGDDGSVIVNWDFYSQIREQRRSDDPCQDMHEILQALGLMTVDRRGTWVVIGCNMVLNPTHILTYYFVREEDARGYAKAVFANAHYEITFWHNAEAPN